MKPASVATRQFRIFPYLLLIVAGVVLDVIGYLELELFRYTNIGGFLRNSQECGKYGTCYIAIYLELHPTPCESEKGKLIQLIKKQGKGEKQIMIGRFGKH